MDERVRRVDEPLQPLRLRMVDIRAALLDEYLELKAKLGPLEKRLEYVRDRLRDLVNEEGHFVDGLPAVIVRLEPSFRKEYDDEKLQAALPAESLRHDLKRRGRPGGVRAAWRDELLRQVHREILRANGASRRSSSARLQ